VTARRRPCFWTSEKFDSILKKKLLIFDFNYLNCTLRLIELFECQTVDGSKGAKRNCK
jgi:hypothetical protein